MADDEFIITLKIEVECYIVFFSLPKFALYSVQRNFMASKSFKVGFSMNIKMMLFHQFVTRLHFEFSLSSVFALSSHLLYPPMSNTACYCKIVKSNTAFPLCLFHRKVVQRQTQPNSVPLLLKNQEKKRREILIGWFWLPTRRNLYDLFPSGILVTPN